VDELVEKKSGLKDTSTKRNSISNGTHHCYLCRHWQVNYYDQFFINMDDNMTHLYTRKNLMAMAFIAAGMATSGAALAKQPNLTFVEIGYGQTDIDSALDDDFKGLTSASSIEFGDNWYMPVSYFFQSAEQSEPFGFDDGTFSAVGESELELDISELKIGIGYKFPMASNSLITVDVNYFRLEAKAKVRESIRQFENGELVFSDSFTTSNSEKDDGASVRALYRNLVNDSFQFNLGLEYSVARINGENLNDTAFIAEGLYHFNENYSIKLGVTSGDDTSYGLSGRYSF
jgi:hypothetical protein